MKRLTLVFVTGVAVTLVLATVFVVLAESANSCAVWHASSAIYQDGVEHVAVSSGCLPTGRNP